MDTVIKKLTIPSLLLLALLLGMGLEVLSHPPKSSTAISEIRNLSTFKAKEFQGERLLKETNEKKDSSWTLEQIEHIPLSIKNQNGSLKQTGSRLETLLKEMGTPKRKSSFNLQQASKPVSPSFIVGRTEAREHPSVCFLARGQMGAIC